MQAVEFNRQLARVASRGRNFVKLLDLGINHRNLMRGPQPLGYARISLLLTLLLGGCGEPQQPTYEFIRGATMGTYYRVQFEPSTSCRPSQFFLDHEMTPSPQENVKYDSY